MVVYKLWDWFFRVTSHISVSCLWVLWISGLFIWYFSFCSQLLCHLVVFSCVHALSWKYIWMVSPLFLMSLIEVFLLQIYSTPALSYLFFCRIVPFVFPVLSTSAHLHTFPSVILCLSVFLFSCDFWVSTKTTCCRFLLFALLLS